MSLNLLERLERIKSCCVDHPPQNKISRRLCAPCEKRLSDTIKDLKEAISVANYSH